MIHTMCHMTMCHMIMIHTVLHAVLHARPQSTAEPSFHTV